MKTRIKKTALFIAAFGLLFVVVGGYFGYQHYTIAYKGENISGVVTKIIETNNDETTHYRPEIHYSIKGQEHLYVPQTSSSQNSYQIGQQIPLKYYQGDVVIDGWSPGLLLMIVFFGIGLVFLMGGGIWMLRHVHRYDEVTRLKKNGRRLQARFVKKEQTSYRINDQSGTIIYVQEEKGNRIFQTKPIFSDFSVRWLEEHLFDVYIDIHNPDHYYVDMEKHFGELQPHRQ